METFDYIKIFFAIISFVFTGRIIYESFNHKPTKNYIFVLNQLIRCLIKNIGYTFQSINGKDEIYLGGSSKELFCKIQSSIILYTSISIEIWIIVISMSTYGIITDNEYSILKIPFTFLLFDIPSVIMLIIYLTGGYLGKADYNCYIDEKEENDIIRYLPYIIETIIMIIYVIFIILIIRNIYQNKNSNSINPSLLQNDNNIFYTKNGKKIRKSFIYSLLLFPIVGFIGIIFPFIYKEIFDDPGLIQRNIFISCIMLINILYPLGTLYFTELLTCNNNTENNLIEEIVNDDEEEEEIEIHDTRR